MSATDVASCINGELPNQTSSELVLCNYGCKDGLGISMVQVQVPKEILRLFRIFRDINEDVPTEDASFYANIPLIKDVKNVPIHFTKAELEIFFELSAKEQLTIKHLEDIAITSELLKRFLLLANFLDYEIYLNTLCQYAAFLIKDGVFQLN
jgi:hypothetical protein